MIRTEQEYQQALQRVRDEAARLHQQEARLGQMELSRAEIRRVMDPLRSFHEQLQEEVDSYERLRRGEIEEVRNFREIGKLLIALRIAGGHSQRELAGRLGVHESQVSRDERNEYHGLTVERAQRIVEALGYDVVTSVSRRKTPRRRGRVAVPPAKTTRARRI